MPSRTCSFGCIVSSEEKCFVVRLDLMLQRAKSFSSERNALCAARLQKTQRRAIRVNTESQAFQIVPVVSRARLKHTFDPLLARICKHKTDASSPSFLPTLLPSVRDRVNLPGTSGRICHKMQNGQRLFRDFQDGQRLSEWSEAFFSTAPQTPAGAARSGEAVQKVGWHGCACPARATVFRRLVVEKNSPLIGNRCGRPVKRRATRL